MIGAELNLIPENDELGFENGKSMFVAIDVKGVMNAAGGGEDVWSQHTGLDVVVILDNSYVWSSSLS